MSDQVSSEQRAMKKALRIAAKKLPFKASKAINQNLSYFCGDFAEAYMQGALDAQNAIVDRLGDAMGKNEVQK